MLDIFPDMDRVMCLERKDPILFDGNENYQPTEGWIQKHPENRSQKMMKSPFGQNFIAAAQNGTQ